MELHKCCRICGSAIEPFMTFGRMPLGNGFLTADQFDHEYYFDLAPAFCDRCGMFQIVERPPREKMFHGHYAFLSGTSLYMQRHFERFAEWVRNQFLTERSGCFVVELGSNDGSMLRNWKSLGYRHLGIEPSENVAHMSRELGVETLTEYFDKRLAERIVDEYGRADAVLAANVMCHIPDLPSVAEGIRFLLKPHGVLVFEDPYLGDMIAKTAYDQIYDEHVFILSATSVSRAFEPYGLQLIDVIPQKVHGGSMRYVLAPRGSYPTSADVERLMGKERAQELDCPGTYLLFKAKCESSRDLLMRILEDLRRKRKRVIGYGATSKSTTVVNYCGITTELVEFISDTTSIKQGKLSPGAHIPVKPHEEFAANYPDFALLFAWNHAEEIREKEARFVAGGGRWIVYVPEVEIVR
jgi:methylation protein EvaC